MSDHAAFRCVFNTSKLAVDVGATDETDFVEPLLTCRYHNDTGVGQSGMVARPPAGEGDRQWQAGSEDDGAGEDEQPEPTDEPGPSDGGAPADEGRDDETDPDSGRHGGGDVGGRRPANGGGGSHGQPPGGRGGPPGDRVPGRDPDYTGASGSGDVEWNRPVGRIALIIAIIAVLFTIGVLVHYFVIDPPESVDAPPPAQQQIENEIEQGEM